VLSPAAAAAAAAAAPANSPTATLRRVQSAVAALAPGGAAGDESRVLQLRGGARVPPHRLPVVTGAAFSDALTVVADALMRGGPQPYRAPTARVAQEVLELVRAGKRADSDAKAREGGE
jgi:hypothetical protein